MALRHGEGPLTEANGFKNQGDVVIFARLAADLLGATKMDRPEDIDANAETNKVYVMLTNNSRRKAGDENAANPRAPNKFGHIIEMAPTDDDHASTTFKWEILVKCGDPSVAEVGATFNPATTKDGWFGMPDNCVVDADGRLWIATDGNSPERTGRTDGVWAMETEGASRGTSKLFFRCPNGAELCGPEFTPDMETFFVAIQHPGESGDERRKGHVRKPVNTLAGFRARHAAASIGCGHHEKGWRKDRRLIKSRTTQVITAGALQRPGRFDTSISKAPTPRPKIALKQIWAKRTSPPGSSSISISMKSRKQWMGCPASTAGGLDRWPADEIIDPLALTLELGKFRPLQAALTRHLDLERIDMTLVDQDLVVQVRTGGQAG